LERDREVDQVAPPAGVPEDALALRPAAPGVEPDEQHRHGHDGRTGRCPDRYPARSAAREVHYPSEKITGYDAELLFGFVSPGTGATSTSSVVRTTNSGCGRFLNVTVADDPGLIRPIV